MAKLSAHGIRLFTAEKVDTSDGWRRTTYSFHQDGALLSKLDVELPASTYCEASRHSYGWKVARKYKNKPAVELAHSLKRVLEAQGFSIIEG